MDKTMDQYAVNLKGVALFCWDRREHFRQICAKVGVMDADYDVMAGKTHAFTDIIQLITGHRDDDGARRIIDSIS